MNEICAWAAATGVTVVGWEGPRLPEEVTRRPLETVAKGSDAVLALGGDGTMLVPFAAPHRTAFRSSGSTWGHSDT